MLTTYEEPDRKRKFKYNPTAFNRKEKDLSAARRPEFQAHSMLGIWPEKG